MDELVADLEKLDAGLLPDAVQEMMARSGGFNVPADYFRSTGMPDLVPASPAIPKKRWPLVAVIGAVGTIVGVIGVVLIAKGVNGNAHALPSATPAKSSVAAATATATPVATLAPIGPTTSAAPSASAAAPTHEVLVSVVPTDATLMRDGKNLGGAPLALQLADGEKATVVVSRKGYKTKTVTLDSKEGKLAIVLDPAWGAPRPGGATAKPAGESGGGLGGIDDVGDPFAKKR
jgi:serine/threonine-protein kinase